MSATTSMFSFEIRATTIIDAPAHIVWQTLTEVDNYHAWSSMLHYRSGTLALGNTLGLRLTLPQGTDYTFSPKVVALEPERKFTWRATTLFRGVFDGEHSFGLEPRSEHQTHLVNREVYSGALAPIIRRLPMMQGAEEGFAAMNQEIKVYSEHVYTSG